MIHSALAFQFLSIVIVIQLYNLKGDIWLLRCNQSQREQIDNGGMLCDKVFGTIDEEQQRKELLIYCGIMLIVGLVTAVAMFLLVINKLVIVVN
jgi:hypothetical protein